jgi:redox-sensitive bicupin YhaK (pirin superfamily)
MSQRSVVRLVQGIRQLEGAGFEVRRPFPTVMLDHLDPFLLLDEMGPTLVAPGQARGAPDHPHRGFETVTYLLAGEMEHADSQGNRGQLRPGDVQWMTAGDGVVHSEMPSAGFQRSGGRLHGFQLWVNLPRRDKRMRPRYQDMAAERIPQVVSSDGKVRVRVIAGESLGAHAVIETRTPILYLHVTLQPGGRLNQPVPSEYAAFAYLFDGEARIGGEAVLDGQMALLGAGDTIELVNPGSTPAELLLIGGVPLNEPVARYGPFVMSSREELIEAFADFRAGRMGRISPLGGEGEHRR